MDSKYAVVGGVLAILAFGAWALVNYLNAQQIDPAVVQELQWKFVDQGVDPDTQGTTTRVFLTIAGVDVLVGGYRGTCQLVGGTTTPLLQDEVSGVVCVRDASGKEIGIFNEGGKLVLKEGDIEFNADGTVISRGNFAEREGL